MLSILTYNIWFSDVLINERLFELIKLINNLKPDIICLQEVRPDVLAVLVNKLKNYPNFETDLNQLSNYGLAIFSRFKILDYKINYYNNTKMDRGYIYIKITKDNNDVNIVTTHLESYFTRKLKNMPNEKYYEKVIQSTKHSQFCDLFSNFTEFNDIFLCGDMNISSIEDKFYSIEDNWNDCWIIDGKDKNKRYTYDFKNNIYINNKTKLKSRLDRIYFKSDKYILNNFELVGNYDGIIPSDHFGIYCSFIKN